MLGQVGIPVRRATAVSVVIALVALVLTVVAPAVPAGADVRNVVRLAGETRIETAVAISMDAFPDGASEVFLARADDFADAVAVASRPFGPILLVPACGPVPAAVLDEIERLDPGVVRAAGGEAAICEATLQEAAAGRHAMRIAGEDRYGTSAAIANSFFAEGAEVGVYLARGDNLSDAVAAGTIDEGPILLVPACGPVPASVAAAIERLDATEVVALGGPAAICDATLLDAANGAPTRRLAGETRIETAVAIAEFAHDAADSVYLARSDSFADAVAGGGVLDGPVLLVPSCGPVPVAVAEEIRRTDPDRLVAFGGETAVCTQLLEEAAGDVPEGVLIGPEGGPLRYQASTPTRLDITLDLCLHDVGSFTGSDGQPATIEADDQYTAPSQLVSLTQSTIARFEAADPTGVLDMNTLPGDTHAISDAGISQGDNGYFDVGDAAFWECVEASLGAGWVEHVGPPTIAIDGLIESECLGWFGDDAAWTSAITNGVGSDATLKNFQVFAGYMLGWRGPHFYTTSGFEPPDLAGGGPSNGDATDTSPYNRYLAGWLAPTVHQVSGETYQVGRDDMIVIPVVDTQDSFYTVGVQRGYDPDSIDALDERRQVDYAIVHLVDQTFEDPAENWQLAMFLDTTTDAAIALADDLTVTIDANGDGTYTVTVDGLEGYPYYPSSG